VTFWGFFKGNFGFFKGFFRSGNSEEWAETDFLRGFFKEKVTFRGFFSEKVTFRGFWRSTKAYEDPREVEIKGVF